MEGFSDAALPLLVYELADAQQHLNDLLESIQADKPLDEVAFRISLAHIYSHLNRAWHMRNMTLAEDGQADWNKLSQFPVDLEPL